MVKLSHRYHIFYSMPKPWNTEITLFTEPGQGGLSQPICSLCLSIWTWFYNSLSIHWSKVGPWSWRSDSRWSTESWKMLGSESGGAEKRVGRVKPHSHIAQVPMIFCGTCIVLLLLMPQLLLWHLQCYCCLQCWCYCWEKWQQHGQWIWL